MRTLYFSPCKHENVKSLFSLTELEMISHRNNAFGTSIIFYSAETSTNISPAKRKTLLLFSFAGINFFSGIENSFRTPSMSFILIGIRARAIFPTLDYLHIDTKWTLYWHEKKHKNHHLNKFSTENIFYTQHGKGERREQARVFSSCDGCHAQHGFFIETIHTLKGTLSYFKIVYY